MSARIGIEGVLQYKTGGVNGGGSWVEITNCRDLTLNLEAGEADATIRGTKGWQAYLQGLKDASLEFEQNFDLADQSVVDLRDAFLSGSAIGLWALDQANGEGLQGDFIVTGWNLGQPRGETQTVSITVKPTFVDVEPKWIASV